VAPTLRSNLPSNLQPYPGHFPLQLCDKNPSHRKQHRFSLCHKKHNAATKCATEKDTVRMAHFAIQPFYTVNNCCLGPIRHPNSAPLCGFSLLSKQRADSKKLHITLIEHYFKANFAATNRAATVFFHFSKPQKKPDLHFNFSIDFGWIVVFTLQSIWLDDALLARTSDSAL
jgi:hypothetical protein